ncbi:DUF2383 domain-containing protein [Roseinatronobacter sp. S2]|uniref:DUF2383 domain-containing protein n=1 Tax=Roseinatronobacter sp. S2 TaxID=3035471 RepID=UPI00240F0EF7|nr:DUF2383 domain-containing protein [Roseinatronobacter sp. S2]WFE74331.1 DUF2383 domain-containing protein [Roseinatronobacter sp. S2]
MKATDIKHLHPKVAAGAADAPTPPASASPNPDDDRIQLIGEVHTRVLDTIAGFEKVVERAEPEFKPVAETFLYMHRKHESELTAYLQKCGYAPENDGSFFGTVNKAVVEMRSWFEDVSENIMDRIIQGEKHVLEAYENAQSVGQTVEANAMLAKHMAELDAMMQKNAHV